ncbi:MAG: DUF6583 family protein [Clostridia bacterium]|nr:hypothetical protein [Clostridium sp.]
MQKKNSKLQVVILIILICILIALGTFSYLYFFTDLLKSPSEAFIKYATQIGSNKNGFISDNLQEYYNKQNSSPYEEIGNMNFKISIPNLEEELKLVQNFNISTSGKADRTNQNIEKQINFNYSNNQEFPMTYIRNKNTEGIQTKYVGKKFIAIREEKNENEQQVNTENNIENDVTQNNSNDESKNNNNNLEEEKQAGEEQEIAQQEGEEQSGGDVTKLSKKVESAKNRKVEAQDIIEIYNNYGKIIKEQVKENNCIKISDNQNTAYKLKLTGEQTRDILIQMLEKLKQDDKTLSIISDYYKLLGSSTGLKSSDINKNIEKLKQSDKLKNTYTEISLYTQKGKLNKILVTSANNKIEISKNENKSETLYNIILEIEDSENNLSKFNLDIKYIGLEDLEEITESYNLKIETPYTDNTLNSEVKILSKEEEKSAVETMVADAKSEKLLKGENADTITDTDIQNILNSGNNEFYTNMKVEKQDEITFKITFINTSDEFLIDNKGKITKEPDKNERKEEKSKKTEKIQYETKFENKVKFVPNVSIERLTSENAVILNDKDQEYINNLLSAIEQRWKDVNAKFMEELGASEEQNPIKYIIPTYILSQNANGQNTNQEEVNTFNAKFELYQSTNSKGATVKGLLTTIQNNNEVEGNNKIEEVNLNGEEFEVTEQNITLMKSSINVEDDYKIEFEKDSDTGLIYRVVVNKK